MPKNLPYVNVPGSMITILEKVRHAQTPERFTQDFLATKLGQRGGNKRQFIPLAKKLGLLGSDGRPTDIYKRFRNPDTSKAAMAEALKIGYAELFERNEHADALEADKLKNLIVEITGLDSKNQVVQLISRTFSKLKSLSDFDAAPVAEEKQIDAEIASEDREPSRETDLRLSYTINLVLPKTDDAAVFNAIFKALRNTLLSK